MARVAERAPVVLGSHPAERVVVDIVDVDRRAIDPAHVTERLAFVLTRTERTEVPVWRQGYRTDTERIRFVVVALYANSPERFADGLPDFDDIVSRLRVSPRAPAPSDSEGRRSAMAGAGARPSETDTTAVRE